MEIVAFTVVLGCYSCPLKQQTWQDCGVCVDVLILVCTSSDAWDLLLVSVKVTCSSYDSKEITQENDQKPHFL